MTQQEAEAIKSFIDGLVEKQGQSADVSEVTFTPAEEKVERVLPEGQRAVRTKSSGDRVYLLDDNKKTRQWVTNPEVLTSLGFEGGDVVEVDDSELLKYQMGSALYKTPEN